MIRMLAGVAALTVIAGSAANLDAYLAQSRADDTSPASSGDVIYRMVGELREIVSAGFVLKADSYFHGGTRHPEGEECHCKGAVCENSGHAHAVAEHKNSAGWRGFYGRLHTAIHTRPVYHLSGAQQTEVLPWFYLATRIDPHNVNAYVLGGYWLSIHLRKPEEAIAFLQEGLIRNPGSWQIYSQLGDIYYMVKRDYAKAAESFRRAEERLPADVPRTEMRHILTLATAAAEKSGNPEQAAIYRRRLDDLFPSPPESTPPSSPSPVLLPGD